MGQYYSGKEVQQPYDTARESVEALNTTAGKGIKQARTSTRNVIDRVKQTASDFTDPHRTILPTPGSFMYQRDGKGDILYGEDGKPVSVRDYKRAGIQDFAENQNKAGDPRQAAISFMRNIIENNTLPDQTVGPMQKTVFELENSISLDQEGTVDQTWFNQQHKDLLYKDKSEQTEAENKLQEKQEVEPESQPDQYRESTIEQGQETTSKIGKIGDKNWEADTRWSGETGDRKLSTPTAIQKDLQKAGFKDEQLVKLMEKNQEFQADRPKISDLLKIFKKD